MNKTIKIISLLFAIVMVFSLFSVIISAKEDEIDFDKYIEDFVPTKLNVVELEKGETAEAKGSVWLSGGDGTVGSSNEDVVTVTKGGKVTAVGYGEAYVVVVSSGGMSQITKFKVVKEKTLSEFDKAQKNQEIFGKVFMVIWCAMAACVVFVFINVVITLIRVSKLKKAMGTMSVEPTQQNANNLLNVLSSVKFMSKFIITHANEYYGGISKREFVAVYTNVIAPSPYIDENTKREILNKLVGLGCVFTAFSTPITVNMPSNPTSGEAPVNNVYGETTPEYDERSYGDAGEDNAWFSILQAAKMRKFNAFFSARFYCRNIPGTKSQEVDSVIVSRKGIFLIEVKSPSHKQLNPFDHSTKVTGNDLADPSMQINMHKAAFLENFNVDPRIVKNLLVISYPPNKKKDIDISTFVYNCEYTPLRVDDLYSYLSSYNGPDVLDDATVEAISQQITMCVNYKDSTPVTKWIINGVEGAAGNTAKAYASAGTVRPKSNTGRFCPNCGSPIDGQKPFCANCGSKL